MYGHQVYSVEAERKYRNFIETLDTDNVHVVRQFRRLVDVSPSRVICMAIEN